ncbi:MAG: polyprenyl synthetase family protein [Paludibacter sp.]|jgi:geranylgeranyl diphosphate synthase type II|nr:polyprenyl synthetase family protein [Paludibacter sp.]
MKSFEELLSIINTGLEQLSWEREPQGLYAPIAYTLNLGGKRIRPALTLMACNLYSEHPEVALRPALGIEVFHNFTLLHDDIMDRATIRRGKPTVHVKWNDNTAILSGDVMQIASYMLVSEAPSHVLKSVLDLFSRTAVEICEGQQYDMEFEQRNEVSADEYIEMIRLKTAVLLGCALKTGAIIGGAGTNDAANLYAFGENIGLAFQLMDDVLDVYGDEKTFGKKIGGDILCNKKTYLLIHARQLAEGETATTLQALLNGSAATPEEKIDGVRSVYDALGVKQIALDAMEMYYQKALEHLVKVSVADTRKSILLQLARDLMNRKD